MDNQPENDRRVVVQNQAVGQRDNDAPIEQAQEGQQQQQRPATPFETFVDFAKKLATRALIIYFISSLLRGNKPQSVGQNSTITGVGKPAAFNLYSNGTLFDMYVFISEDNFVDVNENKILVWEKNGLVYGDWYGGINGDGTYTHEFEFTASKNVQNNGSIYLHTYFVKWDKPKTNLQELLSLKDPEVIHVSKQLNKFKKRIFVKTQNLLTGETAQSREDVEKAKIKNSEIVSHWHPNLTINVIIDQSQFSPNAVPSPMNEHIEFSSEGEFYKPVIFYNDFWNMRRDYFPINETVKALKLSLTYQPLSVMKWQIYLAQSSKSKWSSFGGDTEDDDDSQDSLREMLLETNPILLVVTVVVTILHSIFEVLAFKNDIQFWNNRQSLEGLSVRSIVFNVFQALIVLLYVLDNEVNMVIMISCFVGLLIEIWKINKVIDISLDRETKIFGIFPKVIITDKGSYVESSTKEYDELAFKYLSWLLFPLLAGYAGYSLFYQEHRGWYSWILNMLYSFLLTFGFIMMTPQLFINYKLKSVAHLPWRMMTYKFLNTFIDDIFAFIIKMPTMYRLGCLRDDVVFFIFLYQKWIYKTDPSRVNEFGYSTEFLEQKKLEKEESKKAIAEGSSTSDAVTTSLCDNDATSEDKSSKRFKDKKDD